MRSCGDCSLCCTLLKIEEPLNKPHMFGVSTADQVKEAV
jgi:hypothetical protein